jgi:hypothetical protein
MQLWVRISYGFDVLPVVQADSLSPVLLAGKPNSNVWVEQMRSVVGVRLLVHAQAKDSSRFKSR